MANWLINPSSLDQLRKILAGSLSKNSSERSLANEALKQAQLDRDFDNYLVHILVEDEVSSIEVRAGAGLLLKNNFLKRNYLDSKSLDFFDYIKKTILKGLFVNITLIKNITGNVITALFSILTINNWPQVLIDLLNLADPSNNQPIYVQENSISAFLKICEDSATILEKPMKNTNEIPLDFIIPRVLSLLSSSSNKVRADSISCINQFVLLGNSSVSNHLELYLSKLFNLASQSDSNIRKNVCSAFSLILDSRPDILSPHLEGVTNYCLHTINDSNYDVSLEACEFLLCLATSSLPPAVIEPFLPNMLPILLAKMVYSPDEILDLQALDSNNDSNVQDKDEDIKPLNARNKTHKQANGNRSQATFDGDDTEDEGYYDDYDDDDDDDEGIDDEDDQLSSNWTLRKCAAATLDLLANCMAESVLKITLPILKERLTSNEWPIREAAILAFGAIKEAAIEHSNHELPALIPYLVDTLQDLNSSVRQISCWTLSRYSTWICSEVHKNGQFASYFLPTFQAIMACGLDKKKIVQESACTAIANFITNADLSFVFQLAEPLLKFFTQCFEQYQRKNLVILYDAVQTFVDKIGYHLTEKPEYYNTLLPPLLKKWEELDDEDKGLWPLLECLSSVAATLGEAFAPFALPVYQRSIKILLNCIKIDRLSQNDPRIELPESDFMVTAMDLIDGLIQGLGSHSADLIQQQKLDNPETNLMELLLICFENPINEVRQSAYALLGDLAIFVFRPIVFPYLNSLISLIGKEIVQRNALSNAVCNNATWSLGEMALKLNEEELKPYLDQLVPLLLSLLKSNQVQTTVLENAAITIGRIGICCPSAFAPFLSSFILEWTTHMKYLEENSEKESSFKGICNIISLNPTGFGNSPQGNSNLAIFIDCITTYSQPGEELGNIFHKLLAGYRDMLGNEWNTLLSRLDFESQQVLHNTYNV
ncbi:Kap104p [Ascoidea rubescens DSM 1968]|uniref:Transportin, cytosolic karyopherin beta 2 n=1 Tax=Ascoidea rubescens DSM 1968 TaxID=1344418 RepID=A0A1D2VHJ4_9ASCO|nr:Transportin, cytosolic karyopherin beta 2 [Ascoidea rubescens DSM 1968]ODV61095.1 Transportin, cytosolic karyopherin beta 2 [Ascoidea rubescens DSM 1968]